jgi:hypothetical protein
LARAETAAWAASFAAAFALAEVATMLWHCIMRELVGFAQSFAPDGCCGRVGDGKAVVTGNCPIVDADADMAAVAGPASASPGNVKAATARHAPTAAYSLKRNVNSPEYVIRDAGSCRAQRHPWARTQESSHADR